MASIASPITRRMPPAPCRRDHESESPATRGRLILCLHCSTGSSRQWQSLATHLGDRSRLIAPDLLGYGDNPPWPRGRRANLELEVRSLMGRIPATGVALDVVAHSFGAAIAVKLALMHPRMVRSLTLYEPVLFSLLEEDRHATAALAGIFSTAGHIEGALSRHDFEAAAARFIDFWSGSGRWQAMSETGRGNVRAVMHKVRADFEALLSEPMKLADVARIEVPVLCLSGGQSPAATRRIADLLSANLPQAQSVRIDSAGHMGPLTHAALVNGHIEKFLVFPKQPSDAASTPTPLSVRAA